jgi:hypothetical protein
MGNSFNVYLWVSNRPPGMIGHYAWEEVYRGESLIKALVIFVKLYLKRSAGCVKLEGRP